MRRLFVTLCLLTSPCAAQPDLGKQGTWGDREKKQFLDFLKSNKELPPSGNVKEVAPVAGLRTGTRKARYVGLAAVSDTVSITDAADRVRTRPAGFGGKLLFGGHVFSWVRYYVGVQSTPLELTRLDGTKAKLSHLQIPAGIELALIPLGTPHTRYVILRAGGALHNVGGDKTDFAAPVSGWRTSYNLGLGYEWQIPDTRWRFNVLAETYRLTGTKDGTSYSGLGGTAGLVFTF